MEETVINESAEQTAQQDVTPSEQTDVTPQNESQAQEEASTSEQEASEQVKEEKPIIEGLTYTSQEELIKGVKEKDTTIDKLTTELANFKKTQETKQFEQKQSYVDSTTQQLDTVRDNLVKTIKTNKINLLAQAKQQLLDGEIDNTAFDNYAMQLDNWYDEAKDEISKRYEYDKQNLAKQRTELLETSKNIAVSGFKEKNPEFCDKYQNVINAYFEKGLDAQYLPVVKELLDIALNVDNSEKESNTVNNEAKSRLVSTANNQTVEGGGHIFTRAEIAEMQKTQTGRQRYLKNEATIMQQMAKGLIK